MIETVTLQVNDGTVMSAFVARPDDSVRHPGLIVFQEAFGVNAHIKDIAERFAGLGYVAIAPELFHRTGEHVEIAYTDLGASAPHREPLTDERLADDIRATAAWLSASPNVLADQLGAVGFCMGGRAAYVANSILPLKAAVSFYGSRIAPDLVDQVSQLSGPMLFFWGGQDKAIPVEQRHAVIAALDGVGKPYVNVEFSTAGHGFHCDARASYHPASARQAWALTAEFFKTYLSA